MAAKLKTLLRNARFLILSGSVALAFALGVSDLTFAQQAQTDKTLVIDDAETMEIYSYDKDVVIKKNAKGVLVLGGNAVIEGRVEGDVATIGGSVIQKENAYIGGDVIVLGGKYETSDSKPLRGEGKETVILGGFEDVFKDYVRSPSQLFAPVFTLSYVAQRALAMLFWFVLSWAVATISPGAISRAISRLKVSFTKTIALGFLALLLTTALVVGSTTVLPGYLSATFGVMAVILLILAFIFGRVALNVSLGKYIERKFATNNNRSEALAIFYGVVAWTVLLSIPYLWTIASLTFFAAGIGLVLTARRLDGWKSQ